MLRHLVVTLQQTRILSRLIVGPLGNLGGKSFLLSFKVVEGAESGEGLFEYGTDSIRHHLLRQVPHRLSRCNDKGATLRFLPTAEYLQQRRLTSPVHTHKTDTVVVTYIECDMVEEVGAGKLHR